MNITVILCTYNRCQSLVKALASVGVSRLPESVSWEVLVVDNNSRDKTRDAVAAVGDRYPGRFRYVFEPQPGKSYALNRGVAEARGDVLAFMDDDVTVEPMWLQKLTAPLLDGKWAGCGGRILLEWSCPQPGWLPDSGRYDLAPLAAFDLGPQAGRLTESPFGTNMAVAKTVFAKYGRFRTDLGPKPGSEIRGEDTEFCRRLLAGGEQLWYEPSAIVYHPVSQNRLRKQYFLDYWLDHARTEVRTHGLGSDVKLVVAGIPLRLFRRLAVWTVRWALATTSSRRFSNKLKVWWVAGQIVECYHQAHPFKTESRGNR